MYVRLPVFQSVRCLYISVCKNVDCVTFSCQFVVFSFCLANYACKILKVMIFCPRPRTWLFCLLLYFYSKAFIKVCTQTHTRRQFNVCAYTNISVLWHHATFRANYYWICLFFIWIRRKWHLDAISIAFPTFSHFKTFLNIILTLYFLDTQTERKRSKRNAKQSWKTQKWYDSLSINIDTSPVCGIWRIFNSFALPHYTNKVKYFFYSERNRNSLVYYI